MSILSIHRKLDFKYTEQLCLEILTRPISKIVINCRGGDLRCAWAISDLLIYQSGGYEAHNYLNCFSAALVLFLRASYRTASSCCFFSIHSPYSNHQQEQEFQTTKLNELLLPYRPQTDFFDVHQAKRIGLVDEIIFHYRLT